jgi:polynucleotide 5'-kinase involved in rRNA processing
MADFALEVKVALVGPSDSGKSSLVKFFKGTNFEED